MVAYRDERAVWWKEDSATTSRGTGCVRVLDGFCIVVNTVPFGSERCHIEFSGVDVYNEGG